MEKQRIHKWFKREAFAAAAVALAVPGEAPEVRIVHAVRHQRLCAFLAAAVEGVPVAPAFSGRGALQVDAVVVARLEGAAALQKHSSFNACATVDSALTCALLEMINNRKGSDCTWYLRDISRMSSIPLSSKPAAPSSCFCSQRSADQI